MVEKLTFSLEAEDFYLSSPDISDAIHFRAQFAALLSLNLIFDTTFDAISKPSPSFSPMVCCDSGDCVGIILLRRSFAFLVGDSNEENSSTRADVLHFCDLVAPSGFFLKFNFTFSLCFSTRGADGTEDESLHFISQILISFFLSVLLLEFDT